MSDEEFNKQLKEKHYGKKVPTEADYLNDSTFPYWSSPAITDSLSLLGLSKYKILKNNK